MSGNGNIVGPLTGNLNLRSSGNASSNAVFQVFGIPTNSNLAGLAGKAYDPQDATIRFTAPTVPTPSIGAPLSMNIFRGYALYASVPTVNVTLLTATTLTPNFTGGGGTTYYVAIGTSLGATNAQTTAWQALTNGTTALTLSPSLTVGTTYYVSGYGSNASGTRTLAVSNTTSFVIPTTPTITGNVISNTTFTVTAAVPANALSNVYSLYTQAGVFQAINTTGTFTGLTSNTQYYVSLYAATTYTRSATSNSASVWCLAPATFSSVLMPPANGLGSFLGEVTFTWVNNATSGVTSLTMSINGSNGTAISSTATTAVAYNAGSNIISNSQNITYTSRTYQFAYNGNTVPCVFKLITTGTNTTYTSQSVYFGHRRGGSNLTLTPTVATTVTLTLAAAGGGAGGDGSVNYSPGGQGAGTIISLSVGANIPLKLLIGSPGGAIAPIGTNTVPRATAGDGTAGGSGGTAYYTTGYGTAVGGWGGTGGGASIALLNGNPVLICGAGGGGGSGGTQGGQGGNGGFGPCSANSFVPGGEANANYGNSNAFGHQGGWGGSGTISNRAGDWASPDPTTGYTAGAGGGGYRGTINFVSAIAYGSNGSSWTAAAGGGQGGDGVSFFAANSGGGGGGYGGGGSGSSTNQGSTAISGGGGGGGSWSSVACTFSQYSRVGDNGYGFGYWII